jgi:FMN-dependent NADH-azoreductase
MQKNRGDLIPVMNGSTPRNNPFSRFLVEQAMARLREANPAATTVRRDFGADAVPHLAMDDGGPKTDTERAMRLLSDALIACALPTSS